MDNPTVYSTVMPRRVHQKDELVQASDTAKVLGANLNALMAADSHKDLDSNPKVASRTGLSSSTIHRLRRGQVDATLSTLEKLSGAFHTTPWQLLVPGIQPDNLPALQPLTESEKRFYERVRTLYQELREQ